MKFATYLATLADRQVSRVLENIELCTLDIQLQQVNVLETMVRYDLIKSDRRY